MLYGVCQYVPPFQPKQNFFFDVQFEKKLPWLCNEATKERERQGERERVGPFWERGWDLFLVVEEAEEDLLQSCN